MFGQKARGQTLCNPLCCTLEEALQHMPWLQLHKHLQQRKTAS